MTYYVLTLYVGSSANPSCDTVQLKIRERIAPPEIRNRNMVLFFIYSFHNCLFHFFVIHFHFIFIYLFYSILFILFLFIFCHLFFYFIYFDIFGFKFFRVGRFICVARSLFFCLKVSYTNT